jgi:hypothetical protein
MLEFYFDSDVSKDKMLSTEIRIICDTCYKEAFIFQDEGNYCLKCWQERTEPHVT